MPIVLFCLFLADASFLVLFPWCCVFVPSACASCWSCPGVHGLKLCASVFFCNVYSCCFAAYTAAVCGVCTALSCARLFFFVRCNVLLLLQLYCSLPVVFVRPCRFFFYSLAFIFLYHVCVSFYIYFSRGSHSFVLSPLMACYTREGL